MFLILNVFTMHCFSRFSVTIIILLLSVNKNTCQEYYSAPNLFKPRFIVGSTMGLYAATVFPIDLPGKQVYLGWFFEAIYSTPSNETVYEYPPLVSRAINRQMVYDAVQTKLESTGYPGKSCLLRTICEVTIFSFDKGNGMLGDILHIVLTPSASENFDLSSDYIEAERIGRKYKECSRYHKDCSVSLLDFISFLGSSFY